MPGQSLDQAEFESLVGSLYSVAFVSLHIANTCGLGSEF